MKIVVLALVKQPASQQTRQQHAGQVSRNVGQKKGTNRADPPGFRERGSCSRLPTARLVMPPRFNQVSAMIVSSSCQALARLPAIKEALFAVAPMSAYGKIPPFSTLKRASFH